MGNLEKIQEKLRQKLLERHDLIKVVNPEWLTQSICDDFMKDCGYYYLEFIPTKFKTKEMCEKAFKATNDNINHIPAQFVSHEIMQEVFALIAFGKMREHDLIKINKEFLKEAFNVGSKLNEKLTDTEKAMLLYCYPSMRSECKEIEVMKKAWDIQMDMAIIGFDDEFKTDSYLPDPDVVISIFLKAADKNEAEKEDTFDTFSLLSIKKPVKKTFLQEVSPEVKKELTMYIEGGEKALEEYQEKLADETNYVYTNKGKILSDDLVEMILNGEQVEVLDDVFTHKFIVDYETGNTFIFIKFPDKEGCIMEYNGDEKITDMWFFEEEDLSILEFSVRDEEPVFSPQLIFKAVEIAKAHNDDLTFTNYKITNGANHETAEIYFSYKSKDYKYTLTTFEDGIVDEKFESGIPSEEIDVELSQLCKDIDFSLDEFVPKLKAWEERQQENNIQK